MSRPAPKVAVCPWDHAWAPKVIAAVERGGALVSDVAEAQALVWLEKQDGDVRSVLHPGIEWVQLRGAGVDHWIATGEVDDSRTFTSAKGAYARSVGEHAAALILAASRNLHVCIRADAWDSHAGQGRLLRGATVGIIGAGGIGQEVIRYLKPFGVRIVAVTRSGRDVPGADLSLTATSLHEFWGEMDFVVVLAPAVPSTQHLISDPELEAMPDHAWVINLARGSLVDTDALLRGLRTGRIAGAALDVTEPEPLPPDHELWDEANVIITPHVANPSLEQDRLLADHVEENVRRFVRGDELIAVVDLELGY